MLRDGERLLKTIASPDGMHRGLIVLRKDGVISFRLQWLEQTPNGAQWGRTSVDLGLCDSVETAEREVRAKLSSKLN